MSKPKNKTVIIGRIGDKPSLNEVDGKCYTTFKLSNTTFRNGYESVEWYNIKAAGKQAMVCCQYLSKGDLCCIEGNIKDNHIVAERVTFLTAKKKVD